VGEGELPQLSRVERENFAVLCLHGEERGNTSDSLVHE
jgi:hypothetical protein